MTLEGFAMAMANASVALDHSISSGLEKAAKIIETGAKDAIGTYEFGWPALAPSTVAKHGDTPLLDTGAMRASIEHRVGNKEAWVGTNDPKAAWQEFGTKKIPARPFIGGAVNAKQGEVESELVKVVGGIFNGPGGSRPSNS